MARIPGPCSVCSRPVEWMVSASISANGELVWSRSLRCPHCGAAIEEDSEGLPPSSVRAALISEQGNWSVTLSGESDRGRSVAALRSLMGLDLKEAGALLRAANTPLWSGSRVECLWVKQHLERQGIRAEITETVHQST